MLESSVYISPLDLFCVLFDHSCWLISLIKKFLHPCSNCLLLCLSYLILSYPAWLKIQTTTSWPPTPQSISFIDTHAHLFSALLPCCLWTSSVNVFGWKGQMNSSKHPPVHFQSHHHHHYPYPTSTLLLLCLTIVITVIPTPKTSELQQLVHNTEPKIVCMCVCQIRRQAWSDSTYGFQIFQMKLKLTMEHTQDWIFDRSCVFLASN